MGCTTFKFLLMNQQFRPHLQTKASIYGILLKVSAQGVVNMPVLV